MGTPVDPLYERYRSIQAALGHAVRHVHLRRSHVPDSTLSGIRAVLEQFEWIFTTSYDLLLYWAMGYGDYWPFADFFSGTGYAFDPPETVAPEVIPVLYLHGALHLVVSGKGVTSKRVRGMSTLLDQFGQPISGDPQARPLLVTEGSARDKRRAIEGNRYLSTVMNTLKSPALALPVVVFGSRLSTEDDHLVEALSEQANRAVAISMMNKPKKALMAAQADIYGRLNASDVYFYDASTHPLGASGLRVPA